MVGFSIPLPFDEIDLGPVASMAPEALLTDPTPLADLPTGVRAAAALKYSRAGNSQTYDHIGLRLTAANQARGPVALQTLDGVRLERSRERKVEVSDPIAAILEEEQKLRHRLFDLPDDTGRFSYRVEGRLLQLQKVAERDTETWTFPLTAPLPLLQKQAVPSDAPRLFTQQYRIDVPGLFWLPLSTLIACGRFRRYQDWRTDVRPDTRPGHFYGFVSHRWLSPAQPDPEGAQAAFLAWQMFAHLCDAVRIARYRGLDQPRLRSLSLGFTVGISGSDLSESLLVNVLRPSLDEPLLATAWTEARGLQSLTEDKGVAAATADVGLARLQSVIADCPTLARLVDRIHIWYDYACMPQAPRTPDDDALFRQGLQSLVPIQLLGHTIVLLDETEDYLSRGWCTLEALVADAKAVSMELLIGSARKTARDGKAEHYFVTLLGDRPHIVWRAVLDTEVFRVQTEADCMERLGLKFTDPRDLPFIYQQLRNLAAPRKIHVDNSELVTGAYPVAQAADGSLLVPMKNIRMIQEDAEEGDAARSLDWTDAMRIATAWTSVDAVVREPYRQLPRHTGKRSCHVAVIAACEGEAVLWSNWTIGHRNGLETLLDVDLRSISWMATDIAPVGHFICGTLQPVVVLADAWVVIATQARQTSSLTAALSAAAAAAGVPVWSLALDAHSENVKLLGAQTSSTRRIPAADLHLAPRTGGVFRSALIERLFGESQELADH